MCVLLMLILLQPVMSDDAATTGKQTAKQQPVQRHSGANLHRISIASTPDNQHKAEQHQTPPDSDGYAVQIKKQPPPEDTPLFRWYLLATAIGVAVNAFIWIAILRQTKLNSVIAAAAKTSADAAIKSVNLVTSKERARLRIEVQPLKLPDQTPFLVPNIEYKIRIYGPTEAIIRATVADTSVTDSQEPPIGAALYWLSIPPIISGADSPLVARHLMNPTPSIEADIRDVRKGVKFVHFWGSIVYEDIFTNAYFTNFRFVWRPIVGVTSEDVQRISTWYKCGPPKDNSET
jgi:hypothetical protein